MSEKRLSSAMDIAGGPHSAGWRRTVQMERFRYRSLTCAEACSYTPHCLGVVFYGSSKQ